MAQLSAAEKAVKDFISHQGGQFTVKQAEALRQVFSALIDAIEDLDDRVTDLENY